MSTATRPVVTVSFGSDDDPFTLTGELVFEPDYGILELDTMDGEMPERLSINLACYGLPLPEGHVWIKDWSEHEGVADSLVAAGVAEIVRTERVGPFASRANLLKLTIA